MYGLIIKNLYIFHLTLVINIILVISITSNRSKYNVIRVSDIDQIIFSKQITSSQTREKYPLQLTIYLVVTMFKIKPYLNFLKLKTFNLLVLSNTKAFLC